MKHHIGGPDTPLNCASRTNPGCVQEYCAILRDGSKRSLAKEGRVPGAFQNRVLIVDDDEATLAVTEAIFKREGYLTETARDGFEALAVLRGPVPEILISDLKMPNMSGFELLAVVRKRFPGVGVIGVWRRNEGTLLALWCLGQLFHRHYDCTRGGATDHGMRWFI